MVFSSSEPGRRVKYEDLIKLLKDIRDMHGRFTEMSTAIVNPPEVWIRTRDAWLWQEYSRSTSSPTELLVEGDRINKEVAQHDDRVGKLYSVAIHSKNLLSGVLSTLDYIKLLQSDVPNDLKTSDGRIVLPNHYDYVERWFLFHGKIRKWSSECSRLQDELKDIYPNAGPCLETAKYWKTTIDAKEDDPMIQLEREARALYKSQYAPNRPSPELRRCLQIDASF
ncbi:hypothetical protein NMY22_g5839 [Coprinellus aureogranulatus]|nr:hypothetical protein NMY22_g5839 [Coprinellus aureogranulatus]